MRVSFSQHDNPAGEQQTVETYEKIAAGTRSWTIDVPAHVGGDIEIGADKPGYVFFLQVHYDDYSKAGSEREESDAESGGTSPGENH